MACWHGQAVQRDGVETHGNVPQTHAPDELCTHTYAFELYMRKKRYLLALRALLKVLLFPSIPSRRVPLVHSPDLNPQAVPLSRRTPAQAASVHCLIIRFFNEARAPDLSPS